VLDFSASFYHCLERLAHRAEPDTETGPMDDTDPMEKKPAMSEDVEQPGRVGSEDEKLG
jgi:hypothetical protein